MRGAGRAVFSTCTSAAHSSGFRAGIEVLPPAGVGDPGDRDQPEPVFLGNKFCTAVRAVKVVIGRRDAEQPFSGYLTENAGSADRAPGEPRVRFPAGIRGTAGQDVSRSDVPRPGRMQPDTPDLRMGGGIGHLGRLCKAGVDKNFGNDRCDSALIAAKAFDEAFTQPREEVPVPLVTLRRGSVLETSAFRHSMVTPTIPLSITIPFLIKGSRSMRRLMVSQASSRIFLGIGRNWGVATGDHAAAIRWKSGRINTCRQSSMLGRPVGGLS